MKANILRVIGFGPTNSQVWFGQKIHAASNIFITLSKW